MGLNWQDGSLRGMRLGYNGERVRTGNCVLSITCCPGGGYDWEVDDVHICCRVGKGWAGQRHEAKLCAAEAYIEHRDGTMPDLSGEPQEVV